MSDEKPADSPKAEKPKPAERKGKPADSPDPGGGADAEQDKDKDRDKDTAEEKADEKEEATRSRDQALHRLVEDATELSNGRFGKIVDEQLGGLRSVTNLNV